MLGGGHRGRAGKWDFRDPPPCVAIAIYVIRVERHIRDKSFCHDVWHRFPAGLLGRLEVGRTIEIGLELVEVTSGGTVHQYNLTCVYALHGDKGEAVEWLGRCAERGFKQAALAKTDPDLAAVRQEPGFEAAAMPVGIKVFNGLGHTFPPKQVKELLWALGYVWPA